MSARSKPWTLRQRRASYTALVRASPELQADIEAMKAPSTAPSMAATFRLPGEPKSTQNAPSYLRRTRTARQLAWCGGMSPEGCTRGDLEKAYDKHRLSPAATKEVLKTLWAFRLLGWFPSDTRYLRYDDIAEIVSSLRARPDDTLTLMGDGFLNHRTEAEATAFRRGYGA